MSQRVSLRVTVGGIVVLMGMLVPHHAAADPCHAAQPVCCPVAMNPCVGARPATCSYQSFCGTGWSFDGCGLGIGRYRSFAYATPGLWCGWSYPCVTQAYGWGCNPFLPRVWVPPVVCYPGNFVPAFGPVGVYPFLGFGARGGTTIMQIGRGPVVHGRRFAVATPDAVRPSNPAARDRAAKLVATGDGHLRAALADRAKLQRALDAYRRAETIAADQPDTFLRQAIVLTALDRADDAQAAVKRAIAIDGRLAEASAPAAAAADQPPPDPVFGDRPLGGPSLLAERSTVLIAGIFGAEGDAGSGRNWIADRWSRRWQDGRGLIAAK